MEKDLKEQVENKIMKYTMYVKNFSKKEFWDIDKFAKEHYDNNRRQMILDLIRRKEDDTALRILDDKITLIYNEFNDRISRLEEFMLAGMKEQKEPVKKERPTWKGFGNGKTE